MLYQGTFRNNILLGTDQDNIDDSTIEQACKDADIYDFVMSLPYVPTQSLLYFIVAQGSLKISQQ